MKKKFMLPCIAAVAIASFVGIKTLKSNASECNSLLMSNVEALCKKPKEETKPKTCSTKSTYVYDVIKCPICKNNTGRWGFYYSCQTKGLSTKCKNGFEGSEGRCNSLGHNQVVPVNEANEQPCS